MRKYEWLLAGLLLLAILVPTFAQNGYQTYRNARFDYSIAYPSALLIPQGEAENGDGQKFLSRDGRAEMMVFGSHNALDQSLRDAYEEAAGTSQHPNRSVTYKVLRGDWFVVSGTKGKKTFYQKTILRDGVFKTFRIEYDTDQKLIFNPVTTKIAASFKG